MGYRSEVAYVINFEDKQKLNEFIAKVMVLGGDVANALKECEIEVVDGAFSCYRINFYAVDVKWYESYPDVKAHEQLLDFAGEWFPDGGVGWKFIRIGEEMGDVDDRDGGDDDFIPYDDFYPTQGMEIPFSASYEPVGDNLGILDDGIKV